MSEKFQAIRGMNDILPDTVQHWQYLECIFKSTLKQYGYEEIRFPLVESTHLFKRSIGECTDIVEKEMYTFADLNGDSLSLRPEGTASCVRACLEHGLLHHASQRLWYYGPMYRHEKPQKGRYRQFHQLGVEAYGFAGISAELEMIALSSRLWRALGIQGAVRLEMNTLGTQEERSEYKSALIAFLRKQGDALDADSRRRLDTNPLRIVDSKNPETQALLQEAPVLYDFLTDESRAHFDGIMTSLDALGIEAVHNHRLVRGLDYYSHTVFEWVTTELGAQGTICAGGRYDALIAQLGGALTAACGFAMGAERVLLLMEAMQTRMLAEAPIQIGFITTGDAAQRKSQSLAELLRDHIPHAIITTNMGSSGFKAQFKRADRLQLDYAIVLGDDELTRDVVGIKSLKNRADQVTLPTSELVAYFARTGELHVSTFG